MCLGVVLLSGIYEFGAVKCRNINLLVPTRVKTSPFVVLSDSQSVCQCVDLRLVHTDRLSRTPNTRVAESSQYEEGSLELSKFML